MKNILSLFTLLLIFTTSSLQAQNWEMLKIDKKSSVEMPSKYTIQKTAESMTYVANIKGGTIMIMKMELPKGATGSNVQINVETTVNTVEEGQAPEDIDVKEANNSESEETVETEELTSESASKAITIDGVNGQAMISKIEVFEGVFMWQSNMTFVHNNAIYIFNFIQSADGEEYVANEIANQFFESISFKKRKKRR